MTADTTMRLASPFAAAAWSEELLADCPATGSPRRGDQNNTGRIAVFALWRALDGCVLQIPDDPSGASALERLIGSTERLGFPEGVTPRCRMRRIDHWMLVADE